MICKVSIRINMQNINSAKYLPILLVIIQTYKIYQQLKSSGFADLSIQLEFCNILDFRWFDG